MSRREILKELYLIAKKVRLKDHKAYTVLITALAGLAEEETQSNR